jgi:hypothetical protein
MQKLSFLILGLAIAFGGFASGAGIHRASSYFVASTEAGVISRDGRILEGGGFTVAHPRPGEYVVRFVPDFFAPSTCAALVVQGVHRAIISRVESSCSGSVVSFDIHTLDPNAGPSDHAFGFVAAGMQNY